jgi:hypothetical protein
MAHRVEHIGDATLYLGSSVMVPAVIGSGHDFEVFNPIVGFITVLVVNDLVTVQTLADNGLHNNAMLSTPSVRAVRLGSQRDVAVRVMRFPASEMPMVASATADCLSLQASAASRDALPEGPAFDRLSVRAIAGTFPVMELAFLAGITSHAQPAKSLADKVGYSVLAPIARGGF